MLALIVLFLITVGGWGFAVVVSLFSKSAIHEILAAVYFLVGTVAFCTSLIFETLKPRK